MQTPDKIRSLQRKLYCKAKAEPAFRFYLLYDKICRADILAHAYALARANAGAPGVDGVTFEEIEAAGVEAWLAGLREDLASKTYRPQPVRRVMIPKPGGGERPLGIPTIRDRVAQTAAKLVLEPIFEADLEDSAYGYRPTTQRGRCGQARRTGSSAGATWTWWTPICRNTSTRSRTRTSCKSVARRIVDRNVLRLIKLWLRAPVEERDDDGKRRMTGGKSDQTRHAAGRRRQPVAGQPLHEPLPEALASERTRRSVSRAGRQLRRRLRHPQPRSRGRGAGVDAAR